MITWRKFQSGFWASRKRRPPTNPCLGSLPISVSARAKIFHVIGTFFNPVCRAEIFTCDQPLRVIFVVVVRLLELEKVKNDQEGKKNVSEKFRKELELERVLKVEAINKLAEIMNRKDMSKRENSRVNSSVLRKKEKECKKLQQELSRVGWDYFWKWMFPKWKV